MVTTLTIAFETGKQTHVCVEGDLRNYSLTAKERIKLGGLVLKQLSARGIQWAKGAILYIEGRLGLTGRLESAGVGHEHYKKPLQLKLSYDNLACEDMGLGLPSFVIRLADWRS